VWLPLGCRPLVLEVCLAAGGCAQSLIKSPLSQGIYIAHCEFPELLCRRDSWKRKAVPKQDAFTRPAQWHGPWYDSRLQGILLPLEVLRGVYMHCMGSIFLKEWYLLPWIGSSLELG